METTKHCARWRVCITNLDMRSPTCGISFRSIHGPSFLASHTQPFWLRRWIRICTPCAAWFKMLGSSVRPMLRLSSWRTPTDPENRNTTLEQKTTHADTELDPTHNQESNQPRQNVKETITRTKYVSLETNSNIWNVCCQVAKGETGKGTMAAAQAIINQAWRRRVAKQNKSQKEKYKTREKWKQK